MVVVVVVDVKSTWCFFDFNFQLKDAHAVAFGPSRPDDDDDAAANDVTESAETRVSVFVYLDGRSTDRRDLCFARRSQIRYYYYHRVRYVSRKYLIRRTIRSEFVVRIIVSAENKIFFVATVQRKIRSNRKNEIVQIDRIIERAYVSDDRNGSQSFYGLRLVIFDNLINF